MNERIKELADQATQKFSRFEERDSWEKLFAELIVRECAKIVNDNDCEISQVGNYMLFDHFGIEK